MMKIDRKEMEQALKTQYIPAIRQLGFKGSFPNFHRDSDGFISLINFQFYSAGGSFCVNLSYADKERRNICFRKETEASKLTVSQTTNRIRLGPSQTGADYWFSFGQTTYGEYRGEPASIAKIIATINQLLIESGEPWWQLQAAKNLTSHSSRSAEPGS